MKDIPVFTTQNGVASLILQEIPAQGCAYVRMQATLDPEKLLEECIGFCRMVGADRIYATGNGILESRPFHTAIWEMSCLKNSLEDTDAALWPVHTETLKEFRDLGDFDKVQKEKYAAALKNLEENNTTYETFLKGFSEVSILLRYLTDSSPVNVVYGPWIKNYACDYGGDGKQDFSVTLSVEMLRALEW